MAFAGILDPQRGMVTLTDDQAEKERELARQMLAQAAQARPIGHWTQGAAQVLQALGGVIKENRADTALQGNRSYEADLLSRAFGGASTPAASPAQADAPSVGSSGSATTVPASAPADLVGGIRSTAEALGIDPVDLATAMSYETAGTFDPTKTGPTTKWGQHRGLIQFGEPQAQQYGVDWNNPVGSQLGPDGAVAKYLRDTGVQPGMGLLDIYSAINAGGVGRYNRSDAAAGGAPGTVADKVNNQMGPHRQKAMALLGMTPGGEAQPMPFNVTQAAPAQAQAMPFSPENAPAPQLQQMGGAPVRVASADPNDVNPVLMALARRAGAAPQGAGMAQGGAMPPQAAPAPQQVAQAPQAPQGAQQGAAGLSQGQLIQALQSGRLSPAGQRVVQSLIERNFQLQDMEAKRAAEAADPMRQLELEKLQLEVEGIRNPMPQPTGDMREYEYAKSQGFPGTFQDYQIALKEAGRPSTSVNIDQKAQGALEKTLGEQVGKTFASMYDEGTQAGQDIYQLDRLRGLLQQSGSGLGPALASAAAGFGIKLTDGADAGQAANAIISYLVPRMRVPGTGASSDRDVSLFQKALPSLLNTPEGNAMILETMQGLAEYKRAQGDIAGMVVMGEIDPKEATKMIRGLPDPFARFKSVQQQGVQAGAPQPSVVDGMTATNPQTGQKIIFRNGQWVPM